MSRIRYSDDEIVALLWLFKQSNYTPEVPVEYLLTIKTETGHSLSSLRLYLINIESTFNPPEISTGLRPLSKTGLKLYENYIGKKATGNIDKDGPVAYKNITGEEANFSSPNFASMDLDDFSVWLDEENPSTVFETLFDEHRFTNFLNNVNQQYKTVYDDGRLKTYNSSGKARSVWLKDIWKAAFWLRENYDTFQNSILNHGEFSGSNHLRYMESPYRKAYDRIFSIKEFDELYSWAVEQTPSFTETMNKVIGFLISRYDCSLKDNLLLTYQNLDLLVKNELLQEEDEELDLENYKQVVLQPCSNKIAQENFNYSIVGQLDINDLKKYLTKNEHKELLEISPYHGFWGIVNVPKKTWEKLEEGALVLFFANKKAFAACTLTKKFINEKLGSYLWEKNNNGKAYKYIYTVDEPISVDLPQSFINLNLGYKENFIVQGFQVVDQYKSSSLINAIKYLSKKTEDPQSSKRGSGWTNCNDCGITVMDTELINGKCPSC